MKVSANLLSPGVELKLGRNKYEVIEVKKEGSITRVLYKNKNGTLRTKAYFPNDYVQIV